MDKLKQKVGPLPMYVWIGMVVIAGVGYMLWKRHTASASTSATGTATTGASTLPSTGTTGYVMNGDTGPGSWDGYNNNPTGGVQGPTSTLAPSAPQSFVLETAQGAMQAIRNSGEFLYEQLSPGVFTVYSGGVPTQANINAGKTTPLYALGNGVAATPASTPVGPMQPGAVNPVNTPVGSGAGSPSSAIAPSALSGTAFGGAPANGGAAQNPTPVSTPGAPAPVSVGNVTTGQPPPAWTPPGQVLAYVDGVQSWIPAPLKPASGPLV